MTALDQYARLESTGVWRASRDAQRRDVIVSFGNASLVIADQNDSALTHWSLAAIERLNPNVRPAIFSPDEDHLEQLEIDEPLMIDAIETVRKSIEKARPKPGRLRLLMLSASFAVVAGLAIFWLPDALTNHTIKVVPDVKRAQIGALMLEEIERVSGQPCYTPEGVKALGKLTTRLAQDSIFRVYREGVPDTLHLPGGITLLNARIFEDHDIPDVPAGFILDEELRTAQSDPLKDILDEAGLRATFKLLTTAQIESAVLARNAEAQLTSPMTSVDASEMLKRFEAVQVPSTPYGYALDSTGEDSLEYIEGDPLAGSPSVVLEDRDWISLQGICEP